MKIAKVRRHNRNKTVTLSLNTFITFLIVVFLMLVALIASSIMIVKSSQNKDNNILKEIEQYYNKYYIRDTSYLDNNVEDCINSFIKSTGDKYGMYINPEDAPKYLNELSNKLIGVGIDIQSKEQEDGTFIHYITEVYEGSSAYKEGVHVGDKLKSINEIDLDSTGLSDIAGIIKGNINESFNIEIDREGKFLNFNVVIGEIEINDIDFDVLEGNIGYIKIKHFASTTEDNFKEALKVLESSKVTKYVFDLRNNSGGIVESAVRIIDRIVPEGLIVRVEGLEDSVEYMSDTNELEGDIVVLVNEYTASAAEMFTLALKDYNKATIVGKNTYGKGTQLSIIRLQNNGLLIMTSGLYYTKDSPNIEGIGIEPDITVDTSDNIGLKTGKIDDIQLEKATEILLNN